jgi:FkbM family methyltransferase
MFWYSNADEADLKSNHIMGLAARSSVLRELYAACRQVPVLGSLLHRNMTRVLPPGRRIWLRIPRGQAKGLWIFVDPRFDPDYCNGQHEAWVQDLLRKHLRRGDCFYDVGAHIGFFSLIAARIVGASGYVAAFEPDSGNAAVFRANCERNRMPQITLMQAAVWSSSGQISFERAEQASSGMEGRVTDGGSAVRETVRVAGIALDDYVFEQRGKPPALVKIDAEGGESAVLMGAKAVFDRYKPSILCEIHDPANGTELADFLRRIGYSVQDLPGVKKGYLWAVTNA